MPVFALKLEFDDKGAVTAIRQLGKVSNAAGDAQSELQLFTSQARQTGASLDSLASKAKKLAGALTLGLGLRELNQLRKNLTLAASDAEETANKFNVVFSAVKKQADLAAESLALDYGMSRQGAQASLAQIGDLLTGLGISAETALKISEQTVQLGTDLASFSNYAGGAEGAVRALTSAFLGEYEAAKGLGLVLNDEQMTKYAQSVGVTWKNLDLAEKAQLRLQAAIKQSPNAIGDFARSMGSYANQARVADAILKDFVTSIGQGLLPATTQALASINSNRAAIDELGQSLGAGLGNALDTIVQNFEAITEAVKLAAVAYGTYTVAQRVLTSEFIKGVKAGAQEELAAYRARQAAREASIETARAAQESAAARLRETELTLANIRAKQDHIVSQRQVVRNAALETKAMRELAAEQTALIQANNALAAAEGRSSMAMGAKAGTAAKAAGAAATVAGTAFRGLGAGVKGLVSLMGGPWVAALTVAGTVLYKFHAEAQENAKVITDLAARYRALHEAAQEAGEGIRQASQLELNREAANAQLELIKAQVAEEKALIEVRKLSSGQPGFFDPNWMWDARDIMRDFREGTLDAAAAVSKLKELMRENPKDANEIAHYMDAVYARLQSIEERRGAEKILKAAEDAAGGLGKAAETAATQIDSLNAALNLLNQAGANAPNNAQTAIEWLQKRTTASKSAKEAAEEEAKAYDLIAMALLSMSAAQEMALGHQDEARKFFAAIEEFQGQLGEVYNQQGSKGASSINSAREALQRIREEVEQLNGTSLAGANDLAKKLHEIVEQGKKAGESADSIAKLKNAYIEAFNTQRMREFSDALRDVNAEIASLTGDTATERLIENSRRMEAAIEQLYGNLALPSPEATGEAGAAQWGTLTKQLVEAGTAIFGLGKGLAENNQTEDLQTSVDFYRELRELSGKYTLGLAEQNRLIELQAEAYRRNHIPEQLVKEWELLQKLQNDTTGWGGVRRAAKSYYADSMNWGKQFESLTTSVMDNFVDTMTDGLMKGKLSFSDFADSLIRDIMRISLQASTANIVGGLLGTSGGGGGLLGTLGGAIGWAMGKPDLSSGYTWNKLLSVSTGMIGSAHGNVFASGLEPWSNSVVDRPTYFDASHHITGYARGGVFGEAGPEAVMPLTRMSGGKLGVMASYPDTYAELRELLDDSPARHVNAELAETTRQYMEVIRERGQQAAQERAQAAAPRINVIINNKVPGVEMEQEQDQHRNSDGSLDIIATVKRVVAQDAARRGGQMNQVLRKGFGLNPIITRR